MAKRDLIPKQCADNIENSGRTLYSPTRNLLHEIKYQVEEAFMTVAIFGVALENALMANISHYLYCSRKVFSKIPSTQQTRIRLF